MSYQNLVIVIFNQNEVTGQSPTSVALSEHINMLKLNENHHLWRPPPYIMYIISCREISNNIKCGIIMDILIYTLSLNIVDMTMTMKMTMTMTMKKYLLPSNTSSSYST